MPNAAAPPDPAAACGPIGAIGVSAAAPGDIGHVVVNGRSTEHFAGKMAYLAVYHRVCNPQVQSDLRAERLRV